MLYLARNRKQFLDLHLNNDLFFFVGKIKGNSLVISSSNSLGL